MNRDTTSDPAAAIPARYELLRPLGQGGMATAYLVRDRLHGSTVALKLLAAATPALTRAIRSEFALLTRSHHPHLARVHDFGAAQLAGASGCYYTADFIDGPDLAKFAAEAEGWAELLIPFCDVLRALEFLHRAGLRHGDVKPANILVDHAARGVLIDLGCARPIGLTGPGTVSGTPAFLAPELLAGEAVDGRADLYACGVTLQQLAARVSAPPPPQVNRLVERLVNSEPGARPATAGEVLDLLDSSDPLGSIAAVPARLVGRGAPLERATALLDALWRGDAAPRTLCITGPSGSGRSRMLQELKWSAQLRGALSEGAADEPAAVRALLRRATNGPDLPPGIEGVISAHGTLRNRTEPVVLLLDDLQRLASEQLEALHAFQRCLDPTDPVLLLCAAPEPPFPASATTEVIELTPLGEAELAEWAGTLLSARSLKSALAATAGLPAHVAALLADLAAQRLTESDIAALGNVTTLTQRRRAGVAALDAAAARGLALMAIKGGVLEGALAASAFGLAPETLSRLHRQGWCVPEEGGWKLVRSGDAEALLACFDDEFISELRREIATALVCELAKPDSSEAAVGSRLAAELVSQLVLADDEEAARAVFDAHRGVTAHALPAWSNALALLYDRTGDAAFAAVRAQLEGEQGNPDLGLKVVTDALAAAPPTEQRARLLLEGARCQLKLGDGAACLATVEQALALAGPDTQHAAATDIKARALIQQGNYRQARACAVAGLDLAEREPATSRLPALLQEDIGVASSYLGQTVAAAESLSRAEAQLQLTAGGSPRDAVRLYSYQAINAYRVGDTAAAAAAYTKALTLAESKGLSDQIAATSLNLGTACHQQGEWGRALECYRRGLPLARALGSKSTALFLRFNLAQLHADLGSLDRAEALLKQVRTRVAAEGPTALLGALSSLQAEICAQHDDSKGALEAARRARREYAAEEMEREATEVSLQLIELRHRSGDEPAAPWAKAQAELGAVRAAARAIGAEDLLAQVDRVEGELLLAQGRGDQALPILERARERARTAHQRALEAELESVLAVACRHSGAEALAQRHQTSARELWERIAATLPAELRDPFWRHPRRESSRPGAAPEPEPTGVPGKLVRLLEINRKLSSTLETKAVLRHAMDSAIELTGAERGFVILRRTSPRGQEELHVPVARNLDREQIGKSHLKYSHGIAEQVIATGEPMVTVDALADDRFSQNVSVHAMRLRSVVSVPVRSSEEVLGALYLDNRFQRGRFRDEDMSLLLAFADQVAIALINARLVAKLKDKTTQLEAERQRIEAMSLSQAEEIDRLNDELETREATVTQHRFDYDHIIGRSPAMSEVLALVDRVTDAPFPVLVQGESGTGKELIARAIHDNGPRSGKTFVSVNCAALPEALLESELFGHVKGAFTGAIRDRAGLFVEARGGTLFLDEVGEMPPGMQAKLLRALQEGEVRPLGTEEVFTVDVRLICATNRRLKEEAEAGRFREDLYYRVAVVELTLPPLRERIEDVPVLVRHLFVELATELDRPAPEVTVPALRKLARYDWPGNVRQLRNVLSRALVLAEGDRITAQEIELPMAGRAQAGPKARTRRDFEADESAAIRGALNRHNWNVSEVSRALGIPRTTLYRKLKKYGLA